MSITFKIGKDDITRKINTCLLPLQLVKTNTIEFDNVHFWIVIGEIEKIAYYLYWGKDEHIKDKTVYYLH